VTPASAHARGGSRSQLPGEFRAPCRPARTETLALLLQGMRVLLPIVAVR